MVNNLSMVFIAITIAIAILLPAALIIYFAKNYKISFRTVLGGVITFIVFVLVLEKLVHFYVLILNKSTASVMNNPWVFMLYAGLMAGIFEEVGRFIIFKIFLKKDRQWKDAVGFGIGHGGIEAILLVALSNINLLVYATLINENAFQTMVDKLGPSAQPLLAIKEQLITQPPYTWLLSGFERIFAMAIQIALSILVLYAVKERRTIFLFLAVLIHAVIDFPAALYQKGVITNVLILEGVYLVFGIIAVAFIIKAKRLFNSEQQNFAG